MEQQQRSLLNEEAWPVQAVIESRTTGIPSIAVVGRDGAGNLAIASGDGSRFSTDLVMLNGDTAKKLRDWLVENIQ